MHRPDSVRTYFSKKDLQLFLKFCWLLGTIRPPA
jgi:hypothetical protein